MARLTLAAGDSAIQDIECRKERGDVVAFVVMDRRRPTFLRGQSRLRAVQELDLVFLVAGEHQLFR